MAGSLHTFADLGTEGDVLLRSAHNLAFGSHCDSVVNEEVFEVVAGRLLQREESWFARLRPAKCCVRGAKSSPSPTFCWRWRRQERSEHCRMEMKTFSTSALHLSSFCNIIYEIQSSKRRAARSHCCAQLIARMLDCQHVNRQDGRRRGGHHWDG